MCKLHGYQYACGHFVRYRLSRCRGTFTKLRKRHLRPTDREDGHIAACIAECYIAISSRSLCGSCLYEQFRDDWKARIGEAEKAYQEALEHGMQSGLILWGAEAGRLGDDQADGNGTAEEDGNKIGGNSAKESTAEEGRASKDIRDGTLDRGIVDKKQKYRHGLKGQIEYWGKALDDLRDQFNTESWTVRTRFPTTDRYMYASPEIKKRVKFGSSPLRHEVLPEDVLLGEQRPAWHEDDGKQRYSTFQAFFIDTYGGVSDSGCNDWYADFGGDAWNTRRMGQLVTTDAWDMNVVANVNFANALDEEENGPTGDESYYHEYGRFDVSHPTEDCDQGAEDTDVSEHDVSNGTISPKGQNFQEVIVAYGPETQFPPMVTEDEELLAQDPDAVPP